jgi:crotonobetaine/carnitine-CoA ligase
MLDVVAVAFVIATPDAPTDLEAQIIATCRENLADFKAPRAVYLVDEFPTATLEKVAKHKLRDLADAQPPID